MITGTNTETHLVHPDGVDPFDYITIASVCMGIFKTL